MMRTWIALTLSIVVMGMGQADACDRDGKTGLFRQNNLQISPESLTSNVSKENFEQILDRLDKLYTPIVAKAGGKLIMKGNWESGTVNAFAKQEGRDWFVNMFGGLARHKAMTGDGLALVVCHELGHHLGGYPRYKGRWASNEGQSDYYASVKCFRRYALEDDNVDLMADVKIPSTVRAFCGFVHEGDEERAICHRTALAGLSLAGVFFHLRKLSTPLTFDSPSGKQVKKTSHSHPGPQCRLDTYFYGALCSEKDSFKEEGADSSKGFCSIEEGSMALLSRPRCWYHP
ncbi:MAG: hypothetical protein OXB88_10335 [Bacteriovoracales bacterium]|nr:hypothetical protein [Bacteriovoracales bacterium]